MRGDWAIELTGNHAARDTGRDENDDDRGSFEKVAAERRPISVWNRRV